MLIAFLKSPSDISDTNKRISSEKFSFSILITFFKELNISSSFIFSKLKTFNLESKALFTSKAGFSVVAPIKIISPFSTKGSKKSC